MILIYILNILNPSRRGTQSSNIADFRLQIHTVQTGHCENNNTAKEQR